MNLPSEQVPELTSQIQHPLNGEGTVMSARRRWITFILISLLFALRPLCAQEPSGAAKNEFYAGYGFLSNSFNSYANFSGAPMNGWDAALAVHANRRLGICFEALGLYGTNLGAFQIEHSLLIGPQWSHRVGKVSLFAHGLAGMGFINSGAIPFDNSSPSSNVTFAALAGGGIDTPISPRLAWRVEGDYLRSQYGSNSDQIHNLRGNFAHVTTGIVFRF